MTFYPMSRDVCELIDSVSDYGILPLARPAYDVGVVAADRVFCIRVADAKDLATQDRLIFFLTGPCM